MFTNFAVKNMPTQNRNVREFTRIFVSDYFLIRILYAQSFIIVWHRYIFWAKNNTVFYNLVLLVEHVHELKQ